MIALLLVAGAFLLVAFIPKAELHIAVDQMHSPVSNQLFKAWTFLGDGTVMLLPVLLAVVFFSYRKGLLLLAAYLFSGLGAQFMKRVIWPDAVRPLKYFELYYPDYHLHLVEGVKVHEWHSFPSGHTATAFAMLLAIGIMVKNEFIRYLLLFFAAGVGLSRIWLSQHFLIDVAAGALWGCTSALLAWFIFMRIRTGSLDKSLALHLKDLKKTTI